MISSRFQAILARSGTTRCHIPVRVEMQYDENDPLAFAMIFITEEEVTKPWIAARDLLAEAMACDTPTGHGDVRFRRDPLSGHLLVCIKSTDGHADVKFPLQQVEEFLALSEDEAAEAVKGLGDIVDEVIRGIVGGR